jgi:hypothetical protein
VPQNKSLKPTKTLTTNLGTSKFFGTGMTLRCHFPGTSTTVGQVDIFILTPLDLPTVCILSNGQPPMMQEIATGSAAGILRFKTQEAKRANRRLTPTKGFRVSLWVNLEIFSGRSFPAYPQIQSPNPACPECQKLKH